MTDVYVPGSMSSLYDRLEDFVRTDVDAATNEQFVKEKGSGHGKLDWSKPEHRPLAREWLRIRDELVADMIDGRKSKPPKPVFQAHRPICWAAATESWLDAIGHPRPMTKEQLQKRFASDASGALTIKVDPALKSVGATAKKNELGALLSNFGAQCLEVKPDALTYRAVDYALSEWGYVLLFVGSGAGMGHTLVVWGISINPSSGVAGMKVMDPLAGKNVGFTLKSLRSLYLVMAWRPKGSWLGGQGVR